jgi:hypothetical protein
MKRYLAVPFALILAAALVPSAQAAKSTGAIFTTTATGDAVNENHFDSKCAVYLDGGPGPNAPANAAGLPDGDYYFQVTDPSGQTLLNTDPVSNRRFQVSGGVIVAYTGVGAAPHPAGIDQDHPELGAITIQLATNECPDDYLDTPNEGGVYKVWATPVSEFSGDPSNVDNPCGGGCSHGFTHNKSKTDNFKVEPSISTFCVTIAKEFEDGQGVVTPTPDWLMYLTDNTLQVTNEYFTQHEDTQAGTVEGEVKVCGLVPGAYTVTESLDFPVEVIGLFVNGVELPVDSMYSFTWDPSKPEPVIVFRNTLGGIIGYLDLGIPSV